MFRKLRRFNRRRFKPRLDLFLLFLRGNFIVVLNAKFSRRIKAQIRHGYVNVKKESLPLYRKGC